MQIHKLSRNLFTYFFFFFLEQRKVYCRAKQGEWVACAQNPQTLQTYRGFGGKPFLISRDIFLKAENQKY